MAWSSSNNAVLVHDCESLRDLNVTLAVSQDLITLGNNGFSLQLNCYPQSTDIVNGYPLKWIQYVIAVQNNQVVWGIQYWSAKTVPPGTPGFGYSPANNYSEFAPAPSNQMPAGSVMTIALATGPKVNVTHATFSIAYPNQKASSYPFTFPSDAWCAIYGFQVNLVGPPSGTHSCEFTSGAGILTYTVPGSLAVQSTNTCGGSQELTGETSNAAYADVTPASGPVLRQILTT
jgi:hypothetical protein